MPTALITGATAGLGRQFAEALAADGHDVVLVARDLPRLESVAEEIAERHRVAATVLRADLSIAGERDRVASRLRGEPPIVMLVNNAGFSTNQPFVGADFAGERAQLEVMVAAPMQFCHAALPGMVARGHGTIINVSSIAGWATEGTYSAAKAWVTTFTEGLAAELAGTGVHITAVCPGAIRTEFFERSGLEMHIPGFMWLEPDEVVAKALADARRGRVISVTGAPYHVLSTATQYSPRPIVRFVTAHRTRFADLMP